MDKFLETYLPQKLNQEIDKLKRLITRHEIESVVKKTKTKTKLVNKNLRPDCFTGEFHQIYKEELIPIFLKLFQKIEEEGTLKVIL